MKNKLTALALMLMLGFGVNSASAMNFSTEDPQAQSIWEFFLPFLNAQSASEQDAIEAQFNDAFATHAQDHGEHEDHTREEDEDFDAGYDYSTEKDEILAELDEEILEIEDETLRKQLELDKAALAALDGEAFNQALEGVWEQLDTYWDTMEGDEDDDLEDENYDFATERDEIIAELEADIAQAPEADKAALQSALASLKTTTDEDAFWNELDQLEAQFYGDFEYDDEDDHDCDDHDSDEEDDDDDWFDWDDDEDDEEDQD